jgi:hypothetical protein
LRAENLTPSKDHAIEIANMYCWHGQFENALRLLDKYISDNVLSMNTLNLYNAKMVTLATARRLKDASVIAYAIDKLLTENKCRDVGLIVNVKHVLLLSLELSGNKTEFNAVFRSMEKPLKVLEKKNAVDFARMSGNLAALMADGGKLSKGISLTRTALRVLKKELGDQHPLYAIRLNNLGDFLARDSQFVDAVQTLRHAVALGLEHLPKGHHSILVRKSNLALALVGIGLPMDALNLRKDILSDSSLVTNSFSDLIKGNLDALVELALSLELEGEAISAVDVFCTLVNGASLTDADRESYCFVVARCRKNIFDRAMAF